MILVPDANVLVSALVFGGAPRWLLSQAVAHGHILVTCEGIIEELRDVLSRPHILCARRKRDRPEPPLSEFIECCRLVVPAPVHPPICRDSDDDKVIGCAIAAKAQWIVTGDNDLLVLRGLDGIEILTVREALRRIAPVT